jgi:hypothetical protein
LSAPLIGSSSHGQCDIFGGIVGGGAHAAQVTACTAHCRTCHHDASPAASVFAEIVHARSRLGEGHARVCACAQHCCHCAVTIGGAAATHVHQLPAALLLLRLLAGRPHARIQVLCVADRHLTKCGSNAGACNYLESGAALLNAQCHFILRSGFPKALLDLKDALAATCKGLPSENPGSKWPKTTLGALRDGTRLTPEQLQQLNAICKWVVTGCKCRQSPAGCARTCCKPRFCMTTVVSHLSSARSASAERRARHSWKQTVLKMLCG